MDTTSRDTLPSKVLHFRNCPPDLTQQDLLSLVSPFGTPTHCVVMKTKNQALVQMADLESAVKFQNYYSSFQCNIRGSVVYSKYSSHQELTSGSLAPGAVEPNAGRILLVTIQNPLFPINVDILSSVFGPYGPIEKIVIFQKAAGLQSLVKYSNLQDAVNAKNMLQGQNIFANCCNLNIQFSNLTDLTVHHNTDKTRDFTNPSLPAEAPPAPAPHHGGHGHHHMGSGLMGQSIDQYLAMSQYASMMRGGPSPAAPPMYGMGGMGGMSGMGGPGMGGLPPGMGGMGGMPPMGGAGLGGMSPVVLVAGLSPAFDVDKLFNLFSLYGNITRIKIMHNKRDHALVQYMDPSCAIAAVQFLKGLDVLGSKIDVTPSRHFHIASVGPEGSGEEMLAKDFTHSPLNRFLKSSPLTSKNLGAPSNLLHVSNLPPGATVENLIMLFAPFGTITGSKEFEHNGRHMFLIQFADVPSAAGALCTMHNRVVDGYTMKVQFSANTI